VSSDKTTEIFFYHLERRTLAEVLPSLLQRSIEKGWRATVQAAEERIEALDNLLWTFSEESFLPHGTARDTPASAHPIYLTAGDENPNGSHIRFLLDGAECSDASSYERLVFLFDGRDDAAVTRARELWKKARDEGHAVSYWQQDADGRWQQKA
jgi:DNA polymerase-3 subunit chi